jgi:2-methylcitrate dehydratase PrpD
MAMNQPSSSPLSLTEAIARFAVDRAPAPESALAVARLSLADWAACAIAGQDEPVSRILRALAEDEGGRPQASVFGMAGQVPARMAALVNGAISHALDYDDTHFAYVGHPSVAVFPAALAMAERQDASAAAFLDAALSGMEAACRIGSWLGTAHYTHGFHQTATAGAFGATVAAGRLLGLDLTRMRHALGLVSTRASGLKSQFGTMGKPFNAGIAAANGVEAALLAAQGFVSRPDGIECAQGFGATHAGESLAHAGGEPAAALDGLGQVWWIEAVSHKFHACCHGLHAVLEALGGLRKAHGFAPAQVKSVALRVNPRWLGVCNIAQPSTGLEAKFSYRLTSAMVLAGLDTAALATFSDAICQDAALNALRDTVVVEGDWQVADTAAIVRIMLADGSSSENFADIDTPMPLVDKQARIAAKVRALVSEAGARSLLDTIASLDGLSASDLTAVFTSAWSHSCIQS